MKKSIQYFALAIGLLFMFSCKSIPDGAKAIDNFEVNKYLGTWYEIARLDFRFEEGLNNTTATYSLKDNGTIKVVNRGFDFEKEKWKEAIGKAKFRGAKDIAELKVSFFGPFYAGYNVIAMKGDYEHVLVAGRNTEYLWILSRNKTIPQSVKSEFLEIATNIGFNVEELVWPEHDK